MRKPMLITAAAALLMSMSVSAGNIHFPEELVPLQVLYLAALTTLNLIQALID